LRRLETGDLETVHLLLSNWEVVRYMLLPLCSREESGKFLRDAMDEHVSPAWRSVVRAVVDADSGRLIELGGIAILLGAQGRLPQEPPQNPRRVEGLLPVRRAPRGMGIERAGGCPPSR
jgi:hypothetical protein